VKTTLELQPDLLQAAKQKALEEGKSLKRLVEEALEAHLNRSKRGAFRLRPVVFSKPKLQIEESWEAIASHLYPHETERGPES
jgi:hypothetical protein